MVYSPQSMDDSNPNCTSSKTEPLSKTKKVPNFRGLFFIQLSAKNYFPASYRLETSSQFITLKNAEI